MAYYYVDQSSGVDSAGRGTSEALAYATLNYAVNDIGLTHGVGGATNTIFVKHPYTNTTATNITSSSYGAPATTAQALHVSGYQVTPGDNLKCAIDCNGGEFISDNCQYIRVSNFVFANWNAVGYPIYLNGNYCALANVELDATDTPRNHGLRIGNHGSIVRPKIRGYGSTSTASIYAPYGIIVQADIQISGGKGLIGSLNTRFVDSLVVCSNGAIAMTSPNSNCGAIGSVFVDLTGDCYVVSNATTPVNQLFYGNYCEGFLEVLDHNTYHGQFVGNAFFDCATIIGNVSASTIQLDNRILTRSMLVNKSGGDYRLKYPMQAFDDWAVGGSGVSPFLKSPLRHGLRRN